MVATPAVAEHGVAVAAVFVRVFASVLVRVPAAARRRVERRAGEREPAEVARVVEGIVTLTAIIVMLALAGVLAYGIAASCTGQFERRSDLKDLPGLSRDASYSPAAFQCLREVCNGRRVMVEGGG